MVELADTRDLGSRGKPCRFKSCYPHHVGAYSVQLEMAIANAVAIFSSVPRGSSLPNRIWLATMHHAETRHKVMQRLERRRIDRQPCFSFSAAYSLTWAIRLDQFGFGLLCIKRKVFSGLLFMPLACLYQRGFLWRIVGLSMMCYNVRKRRKSLFR